MSCIPTKAEVIRLIREHRAGYTIEYTAITTAAGRLGMAPETLRLRIRRDEAEDRFAAIWG